MRQVDVVGRHRRGHALRHKRLHGDRRKPAREQDVDGHGQRHDMPEIQVQRRPSTSHQRRKGKTPATARRASIEQRIPQL
eukprot:2647540-Pleurochrysis_carterae.AAC.1